MRKLSRAKPDARLLGWPTAVNAELPTAPVALLEPNRYQAHPSDVRPSEARPSEARPSEVRPSEVRPSEVRPSETHPSGALPRGTQAIGSRRGHARLSATTRVVADLGSLVTLSALALLGVAAAAGMIDMAPAAESPTYSVTFADH